MVCCLLTCCGTSLCRRGAKRTPFGQGSLNDMQIARFVPSKVNEKMQRKTKGEEVFVSLSSIVFRFLRESLSLQHPEDFFLCLLVAHS